MLKYKLESLVPTAEVFIDTDMGTSNTGLLSTGDLQQAIANTTMMVSAHVMHLVFLLFSPCTLMQVYFVTFDYFESYWCRMEMKESIESSK